MIFLELYFRFFFVGLFAIGGGLATVPFLQSMGEATGWFNQSDIADMIAISESTPGPIGVNMATYVGYQSGEVFGVAGGIFGGVIATLGLITPSIIVIVIVARMLQKFKDSKYVEYAFYGLRAASIALVASACLGVAKIAFWNAELMAESGSVFAAVDYKSIILSAVIFFCVTKFKKLHPIALILFSAVVGILLKM
ncbi:MAG: chromate transporter [Clostridia bacterium]|nr:chromate transporter [Clostridia bacterium]MBQ5905072.1 chromate transporter [Clostridia bacterium]